jgi:hypothetical protein
MRIHGKASRSRRGIRRLVPSLATASTVAALMVIGVMAAGACTQNASLPGTSLGTYSVVGTLGTNTCGSGVGPASPWDFTVEMSQDDTTLYLAQTDGSDEVSGTLVSTSATLTSVVTTNVDGSEAGGPGLCDLTSSTTFVLKLAAGATPASFTGSVVYTYAAATGVSSTTNCSDQLSSSGGTYATLPCSVNYTLKGTRQ